MIPIQDSLTAAWRYHQAGDASRAGQIARQILQADPHHFDSLCLLGDVSRTLGDLDQAVVSYRRAALLRPDHAETALDLGNCLFLQKRFDEAAASYRRALQLRPDYPQAHTNLGSVLQEQGQLETAVACHREAARIDSQFVDAHFNLANACKELGRNVEAVAGYTAALRLRPNFAEAHLNLGLVLLLMGRLEEGWPHYEWRFQCGQPVPRSFAAPQWDGSSLPGQTLLVHAEQGCGDILMFVRYNGLVKRASGMRIVLECPAAMMRLLSQLPDVDQWVARGSELPDFDAHAPLLSLPAICRSSLATIPAEVPYLAADATLRETWQRRLNRPHTFNIGIAWQGDPTYRWDRLRSIPLERFSPLADIEGVRLYSLQKGPGTEQLHDIEGWFSVDDLGGQLDNSSGAFMDTAAVMMNLDLVISPDTAVAHVAGALGVVTWLVLPTVPHWPWMLDREDTPWYPTMRLFRQRRPGQWGEVFERMTRTLRQASSRGT
ncbi:MAG: tetratricopeptide repeat-containing glycosyltransferase family protein [Planctomycetota bacterium]